MIIPNSVYPWGVTQFTATLPKFYWDVETQEQRIKLMCRLIQNLIEGLDANDNQTETNRLAIEELKKTFEEFKEHGFDDYYKEQVIKWIQDNINLLYTELTSQVFFGLTDDGYFCAYIPDSWDEISFDTGAVFGRSDYGRLILRFDANGTGVINNTHEYTVPNVKKEVIQEMQGDVELLMNLLYTPMNELVEGGQ